MELSNNCKRTSTISATEIVLNGDKYFYRLKDINNKTSLENIEIYKFNETLNGYQNIHDDYIQKKILNTFII